ncbi:MAG: MarR family transcriptional regulator [Candidatus Omnitrophica bacterium]|nr:MarR family transcriptional regulator [Candidatus Omnitrophota bacterium]
MSEVSLLEFADKISLIMPQIMREFSRHQADELHKGKITLPQFLILENLNSQGQQTMTALARYMHVTTAAMTGIIDRVVRDGYVVRTAEPDDRRIIRIKISPKGIKLVEKFNKNQRSMILKIFGKISDKDRRDYLRILMQIRDILVTGINPNIEK